MKKSVIVVIIIVYIASIFFVGFFGIAVQFANETIYVTAIQCINENRYDPLGNLLVEVNASDSETNTINIDIHDFTQIYNDEEQSLKIDWRVYPADATFKNVRFAYSSDEKRFYVDKDNDIGQVQGTVHFTPDSISTADELTVLSKITLQASDGHGAKTYVRIRYIIKENSSGGG